MKITKIDCHVLLIPDYDVDACSSAQDDLVVVIHTDEGIVGIGETDTNPWIARACIEGAWHQLHGPRHKRDADWTGSVQAESAVAEGVRRHQNEWPPRCFHQRHGRHRHGPLGYLGKNPSASPFTILLGGPAKSSITPYASLLPTGHTLKDYRESLIAKAKAAKAGFSAGENGSLHQRPLHPQPAGRIRRSGSWKLSRPAARRRAGIHDDWFDVAYCWPDAKSALRILKRLEPYDLFFLETPIDIDDLMATHFFTTIPRSELQPGEFQNSHWNFSISPDRGKLDVLQPDVGRRWAGSAKRGWYAISPPTAGD